LPEIISLFCSSLGAVSARAYSNPFGLFSVAARGEGGHPSSFFIDPNDTPALYVAFRAESEACRSGHSCLPAMATVPTSGGLSAQEQ
jgi:hypothetical protein